MFNVHWNFCKEKTKTVDCDLVSRPNEWIYLIFVYLSICSEIYCNGDVLHAIQMAKIFNDSKTFVDMKLKRPSNETVKLFREFMNQHDNNPSKEDIIQFVSVSFSIFVFLHPLSPKLIIAKIDIPKQ